LRLQTAFASPEHKRRFVRSLFATIADRYDLITVLLSFGRDRHWKRRLATAADVRQGEHALDLACGTGDIAFEVAKRGALVIGLDITTRMVEIAQAKARAADNFARFPQFLVADMMALPLDAHSVDLVTTGYGLRNVPAIEQAIVEIARVLKPGGRLLSLDFNRPESLLVRSVYLGYLTIVGSTLGWVLHRNPDTYRYIPESVRRYPGAAGVAAILRAHGFHSVSVVPLFAGFMTLHIATRALE
jgi:demethylmenaquinone methyltransferase/2-methoxy-6-polyprenyl-1,4-benzoquinol methylase